MLIVGVQVHWLGNAGCIFQEKGACAPDAPDYTLFFLECSISGGQKNESRDFR